MKLNEIRDNKGALHVRKLLGRGIGSGLGKTAGKGHKGQKARGTGKVRLGFEGGQNPIYRRLPKRGFNNHNRIELFPLNFEKITDLLDRKKIDPSKTIDEAYLREIGLIKGKIDGISLLAKGELTVPISVSVNKSSQKAQEMVSSLGGKIDLIPKTKFINKKYSS